MKQTAASQELSARTTFPVHGWVGITLILVSWPLNWFLPGLRTHIFFFPLWLGYILAVDALVLVRRGTSLLVRSRKWFFLLFVLSAPVWWVFEGINLRTANWEYLGRDQFSDLAYAVLATVSFSTVMPAVFETAELVRSFGWVERLRRGPVLNPGPAARLGLIGIGIAMLTLLFIWPTYFYCFAWGWVFFIIEPINLWLGHRSLFDYLRSGDWRPVVSLSLGALICGFFWELWNYYAYPKWKYHTPGVEFWYIFEMPLLGYIGYLPFALELYTVLHLVSGRRKIVALDQRRYG